MTQSPLVISTILCLNLSLSVTAQKAKPTPNDTTAYSVKNETIKHRKYSGYINPSGFYLFDYKKDKIVFQPGEYFTWELRDFNGDGNKDILLDKGGNTPERYDLLLFNSTNRYILIEEFDLFPAPTQIKGTKYYYSYHRSGCADMNWDSDLFYIQNFKAIRIGNISGRECEKGGVKVGLYINKVQGETKTLVNTLPIATLGTFKNHKWGFIKTYWTNKYKQFL